MKFEIRDLNSQGQGVTVDADGKVCFVNGALPGEKVSAKLLQSKRNYSVYDMITALSPSPNRTKPACVHFGDCGGCDLQHLSYAAQLQYKTDLVRNAFLKIAKINLNDFDYRITASKSEFSYRNKLQMPYRKDKKGRNRLGMYRKNSHHFVPIDKCLIHNSVGEEILKWIADKAKLKAFNEKTGRGLLRNIQIRAVPGSKTFLLILVVTELTHAVQILAGKLFKQFPKLESIYANINSDRKNRIFSDSFHLLKGKKTIAGQHSGIDIEVGPSTFLQVNDAGASELYEYAIELAELSKDQSAADLYCGIGILSCRIAQKAKSCIGFELNNESIEAAKVIASNNQVDNIEFVASDVFEYFSLVGRSESTLFLDPPRKGCSPEIIEKLCSNKQYERLIYISCDPGTLARDLDLLCRGGEFHLHSVHSFDLFPQTTHVETVLRLDRAPSS